MEVIASFAVIAFIIYGFRYARRSPTWRSAIEPFPKSWRIVLLEKVSYYNSLNEDERGQFERRVAEFLLNYRITGIRTTVDDTDRLLVAASAIIPIFAFPEWRYSNLQEVLLYPSAFNQQFETSGSEHRILGMVGTGYMSGKMILSKSALHKGFSNESDKKNTAIHEFVHLIDMTDGVTDGIPKLLLEKQYTIPWLELVNKHIEAIYEKRSDINPYGGTNRTEFFAVISEYFFERPKLLASKHPELYKMLEEIFEQNMSKRVLRTSSGRIGRNDDCPCGSNTKFKKCCGKEHYS